MKLTTNPTRDGRFFCLAETDKHRVWAHGKTAEHAMQLAVAACMVSKPGDYVVSMYGELLSRRGDPHAQIRGEI